MKISTPLSRSFSSGLHGLDSSLSIFIPVATKRLQVQNSQPDFSFTALDNVTCTMMVRFSCFPTPDDFPDLAVLCQLSIIVVYRYPVLPPLAHNSTPHQETM